MVERHPRLCLAVVAAVTVVCFAPVFQADFVELDDRRYALNPSVTNFDFQSLLTEPFLKNYHPLTMVSLAVDHAAFGGNPGASHAVNLLLHVLISLLVVLFVWRLMPEKRLVGLGVGVLFAIHPLHVESVAWISERKDLLCALFFLLSLLAYQRYAAWDGRKLYFASLALFALAVLSKSMAVTLPVVLLLLDLRARRKLDPVLVLEKLPYFVLSIVFGLLNVKLQRTEMIATASDLGIGDFVRQTVDSLAFYLSKSIVPSGLSVMYHRGAASVSPGGYVLAAVVLGLLVLAMLGAGRLARETRFGVAFFAVTIFLVVGIVPFSTHQLFADRYFYIPSIGLFYAYAVIVRRVLELVHARRSRTAARAATAAAVVLLATLGLLTFERSAVWKNSETLFEDVIAKYPRTARAYVNLGVHRVATGRPEQAIESFKTAIELSPRLSQAHMNLAVLYRRLQRMDEALEAYKGAVAANPYDYQAHGDLGVVYKKRGDFERAEFHYRKALEIEPDYFLALANLGVLYLEQGRLEPARQRLGEAIAANPSYGRAYYFMADVLYRQQHYDLAVDYLKRAVERGYRPDPAFVERVMRGRPGTGD